MPFSKFHDTYVEPYLASQASAPRGTPQLFDHSIWQHCDDDLGQRLLMPSWVFPLDLYTSASARIHPVTGSAGPTLFLAAAGTGSSLHVDTLQTHFWMMLCHGTKRWRLVCRDDVSLLHPLYLTDLNPVFPADLNTLESLRAELGVSGNVQDQESVDWAEFRHDLHGLTVHEVLLQPGDLIFVPAGWPHQVDNVDTSVAVSSNFVDASNLQRCLEEAEILGLVEEDPQLLANAMRNSSKEMGEKAEPPGWERLRAFKARHGELRSPREVQRLLKQSFGLLAFLGLGLGLCMVRSGLGPASLALSEGSEGSKGAGELWKGS